MFDSARIFAARGLSYVYPGNIEALKDVNFDIGPGEVIGLMGANGAGKSTLLKLLDGLIFPTGGALTAFGAPLSAGAFRDAAFNAGFRRRVGLVFQDPDVQLFASTVWEEVTFGPLQLGISRREVIERAEQALEVLNIGHLRDRAPYLLSGGEKKRVSLAGVLSLRPRVLLLDEPTAGLDPYSQGRLIDFLLRWANRDNCLIFSTQDLDIVEEMASRVIIMGAGHVILADGAPDEFLSDPDFLLRANLVHEHSHRHKTLIHSHRHQHEHHHLKDGP